MNVLTLDDLHYTYKDYVRWKGDWELIEGIPVAMSPAPSIEHQSLSGEIAFQLRRQLEDCSQCRVLGEVDYRIDEETVVRPDVLVICQPVSGPYLTQAPELIVEVVSPSTARRDEKVKFQLYAREKVRYYVLAYPHDRSATVYRLENDRYDKVGDALNDATHFEGLPCPLSLDFGRAFRILD